MPQTCLWVQSPIFAFPQCSAVWLQSWHHWCSEKWIDNIQCVYAVLVTWNWKLRNLMKYMIKRIIDMFKKYNKVFPLKIQQVISISNILCFHCKGTFHIWSVRYNWTSLSRIIIFILFNRCMQVCTISFHVCLECLCVRYELSWIDVTYF